MDQKRSTQALPARSGGAEQTVELELRLCIEHGSASPSGHTRDQSGREHSFHGWLALLGVLESLCGFEAPPRDLKSQPTPGGKR
jgi:hypothetical protein